MMKVLVLLGGLVCFTAGQTRDSTTQPVATARDCICSQTEKLCSCKFVIEHRLTMILEREKQLVYPDNGVLRLRGRRNDNRQLTAEEASRVITADGVGSRLVIAINGVFPGPRIEVYQGQTLEIEFVNTLHTDSVTVHFHGLHQKGSPWMDGVAFITQCPILPGQTFVQRFTAFPPGTHFYHAHIGDQRSMGLYGPLVVRTVSDPPIPQDNEIIVTLQDWNHLMDAETAYHRMITEQFNFDTGEVINTTFSVDRAQFSRFEFQSGLVNGKGRFWSSETSNNGAPLERYKVDSGKLYRFRVIGAMTLYPMRVFIQGQRLILRGSDAFNLERITVQSIVVHPGERYDFLWQAPSEPTQKEFLLIAETIEARESISGKYHAAEAVIEVTDAPGFVSLNPPNNKSETCTAISPCVTFNCPYAYYPQGIYRSCVNYGNISNIDPIRNPQSILGSRVDAEYFFNFAFPGTPGNTPGSVNGREFVSPTGSLLTQSNALTSSCNEAQCSLNGICTCTYIQNVESEKVIQMVFMNLGNGSGWSHPIHLHGHSFYVMKVGLGKYHPTTAVLLQNSEDINCTDRFDYCSEASWANPIWAGGNLPEMNDEPPEKDTIVVPTGGYVVIRFRSDNPGMWFLHCHIDLHNTNGMAMVINEGNGKPAMPEGFPTCGNFLYDQGFVSGSPSTKSSGINMVLLTPITLAVIAKNIL